MVDKNYFLKILISYFRVQIPFMVVFNVGKYNLPLIKPLIINSNFLCIYISIYI